MDDPGDNARRWTAGIALAAVGMLLLKGIVQNSFVDPDLFHEMALIRDAVRLGHLPLVDTLAYTPTVYPTIHHEWGTGVILYLVSTTWGGTGLLLLKYLLSIGIAVGCVACARRRGASLIALCSLAPMPVLLSWLGFTTVRAQMFTLLFSVALLYALDRDREGRRWWIAPWLLVYTAWLNLHGGFIVGLIFFAAHTLEQLLRRKPARHLILTGLAMLMLVFVNPYGPAYVSYLWRALGMDRPAIEEWAPIWTTFAPIAAMYVMSLLLVVYAVAKCGIRKMPGLMIVLLAAYAAMRHQRHASIYAVVWLCYVPAYIESTVLGHVLIRLWERRPKLTRLLWATVGLACLVSVIIDKPWELSLPANPGEHPRLTYPVGAVQHLTQVGFEGNLMTPFVEGAFVAWKLSPKVKISIDGRYEVAYPPGSLEEHRTFYAASPGWRDILAKYPTDLVLTPADDPIAEALADQDGWSLVYRDDAYELFARPGLELPTSDRRGQVLVGSFP